MAMIDYGTIVVRNGVIQNAGEMFMKISDRGCDIPETIEAVDSSDKKDFGVSGEYFAYAGDLEFLMCFYKREALIVVKNKVAGFLCFGEAGNVWYNTNKFYIPTKSPFERFFNLFKSGIDVVVENIDHEMQKNVWGSGYVDKYYNDKYHISFDYKGDRYDIYTGYGIDNNLEVYNRIKFDSYGYTETERRVLDEVFGIRGNDDE